MKLLVGNLPLAPRADMIPVSTFDDVVDALHAHRREPVLVIAEPESHERSSRVARNAVAGRDVVLVVVDGYRTARVQVAAGLATLGPRDYGLSEAVRDELAGGVFTRLALAGVARLARPAPSIAQQITGWWPTTRFEVDAARGTVRRTPRFEWSLGGEHLLVEAGHDPKGSLRIDRGERRPDLVLEAEGRPAYASRTWAEQSAGPGDVETAAAAALERVLVTECEMCGRRRAGEVCLWCGTHVRREAMDSPAAGVAAHPLTVSTLEMHDTGADR